MLLALIPPGICPARQGAGQLHRPGEVLRRLVPFAQPCLGGGPAQPQPTLLGRQLEGTCVALPGLVIAVEEAVSLRETAPGAPVSGPEFRDLGPIAGCQL